MDLYSLQNGTDIRGVAYKDENSDLEINLTEEVVSTIAKGFVTWISKKSGKKQIKIALGIDSRITGPSLKSACAKSLSSLGIELLDCGLATTPSMFMTTILDDYKCDGSIMFTASHMPYVYNGMKMFTESGCLNKEDLKEILDICTSDDFAKFDDRAGKISNRSLLDDYSSVIKETIIKGVNSQKNYDKPLSGMKIIVDAGNGSGGFFADKVLADLGADTSGSQFLEPDGMFPNHIPNPENKRAMESISKETLDSKADMGIIFDTDVDRAAVVSNTGKEINKNALIALISAIVLEEDKGSTIVTDSVTSEGLTVFIESLGGIHHRFKRGYKNVINESIRLNNEGINSALAIETSGHAAMKENYFLDDGSYLVAKIIIKAAQMHENGQKIWDLIENLNEAEESFEFRIKIKRADYKEYANKIIDDIRSKSENLDGWDIVKPNYEGVRVRSTKDDQCGWFLLRSSLHEPLLVLNIESNIKSGSNSIYWQLRGLLEEYELEYF